MPGCGGGAGERGRRGIERARRRPRTGSHTRHGTRGPAHTARHTRPGTHGPAHTARHTRPGTHGARPAARGKRRTGRERRHRGHPGAPRRREGVRRGPAHPYGDKPPNTATPPRPVFDLRSQNKP
ncbi:hypothetical protein FXF51_00040 [Nonomuraea sp. PA05]|nr:hypothetical protein FXF51_00040 [Nonomuraea sp. PA05]